MLRCHTVNKTTLVKGFFDVRFCEIISPTVDSQLAVEPKISSILAQLQRADLADSAQLTGTKLTLKKYQLLKFNCAHNEVNHCEGPLHSISLTHFNQSFTKELTQLSESAMLEQGHRNMRDCS